MRRHKIDILKHVSGHDEYGEPIDTWEPFKTGIWANKSGIIGKEFYSALSNGERVDAKFSTGYFEGVKSEMRLRHGNDLYEIIGPPVNIEDKNMELLFYCRLVTL